MFIFLFSISQMPAGFNLAALMSEKEERDQKVDGVGTKVIKYPQRVLHSLFFTPSKKIGFSSFSSSSAVVRSVF